MLGELVIDSLRLDVGFLRRAPVTNREKWAFLGLKYWLLARHTIRPFHLGSDSVQWLGRRLYYDSRYGLAGLQRALSSHTLAYNLAGLEGMGEVAVVVDIGANVGWFTLTTRLLHPGAQIHCVEPVPPAVACLRHNMGGDNRTVVHELAVADAPGTVSMSFDPEESFLSRITAGGGLQVMATTIDALVSDAGLGDIDVLKIDTETFEDLVLDGAVRTLARTRYLFLEITIEGNARYTVSSLLARLSCEDFDYQLVAARNFSGRSEGPVPVLDALLVNKRRVGRPAAG